MRTIEEEKLWQDVQTKIVGLHTWNERLRVVLEYLQEFEDIDMTRLCVHEAAHAVLHVMLHSNDVTATVDPINILQHDRYPGIVTGSVNAYHASPFDHMVAGFAGVVIESVLYKRPFAQHRFDGDRRLIRHYAAMIAAQHLPDHTPGSVEWSRYTFGWMLAARRKARKLIESPSCLYKIIAVGWILSLEGTLSGSQVRAIMEYVNGRVGKQFRSQMMRMQETYETKTWPWQIPDDDKTPWRTPEGVRPPSGRRDSGSAHRRHVAAQ